MNTIITQHNILNPHDRMVLPTYATHSSQILDELLIADGFEVTLYKNSELQLEPFDIKHGDIINVVFIPTGGRGGGKSIISLVAMIGLAVVAPYATASLIGGLGIEVSAMGFYALQAGVMVAGAMLINSVLSPSTPSLSTNDNLSTSTTYSWDESYNKFQQGLSIPKVFGTHKITPPLISKYIETIDNKQYFNGLYAVNDGLISNLTDIKINDESIDNFDNVTIEVRNGANVQGLISNFDNTFSDRSVNKKLSTSWADTETTGNQATGLNVVLVFPRGLFYANDSGGLSTHSVKVVLEYSSDNVNWTRFGGDTTITGYWYYVDWEGYISQWDNYNGKRITSVSSLPADAIRYGNDKRSQWYYTPTYSLPYTTISGAETSTIRKTFKLNYLAPSKYYVRARFYEEPPTTTRYGSDCYLEYITEEIGDDFTYPNTALISVRALATDQLSGGNPKISCIVSANSSNPALICKQMLTESGIDSVRILSSFNEWEAHCNNMGYAFNGVIDTSITLRKALDLVSTAGRGSVIQFGSKFEVIMDRAETIPVQSFMFGMGNILKDSFSQSFLPILDRANVIEATYYDAHLDYEPTIVEVSNNNYDSVAEENRTSVTLVGFTNRQQAIKHCRYLLNCNRYLTETVSIEADKDSLVCKYGDIVRVSHDVPQYGFSGRIKDCTLTTVTIDREVTMVSGKNYYIQLKDNENNIIEHYVNNSLSTTDTLTFTTPLTEAYTKYDNYSFGEVGKASKLFRVLRISTASDMTRTLSLLEYNEDVYNDSGDIDVPFISSFGVSNLRATDYIRYAKDGSIETVMQLAWNGQSISYNVSYKKATQSAYNSILSHDCFIDLIVDDTLYDIIITDTYGQSVATQYQVIGKSAKPNSVTNLTCTESGNVFSLNWDYENDIDFKEFVILLNDIEIGRTRVDSFSYFSLGLDTKKFTVVVQDTSGNNSDYVSVNVTAIRPSDVKNFKVDNAFTTRKILTWDYNKENDFKAFEIRMASGSVDVWENAKPIHTGDITQSPFVWDYAGLKEYTLFIKAIDTGGNYSLNADRILFNVGDMNLDNILETISQQTSWTGTLTNGTVSGGKLITLEDNTKLYYQTPKYGKSSMYDGGLMYVENNFYSGTSTNYVYGRKVPILDYIFYTSFASSGNVKFTYDIDGDFTLKYVVVGGNKLYSNNAGLKYNGGNIYSDYINYIEYTNPFAIEDNTTIKWQLNSTGGGLEATELNVICDVEDKYDLLNDKVIPIGGAQIPPTQTFHQIQNVLVTLQGQGIPRVTSKNPTGATIQVFNTSGVDIGGVADIQYKGY